MLQRIAVEPGHRGPTVAITTKRVVSFRQHQQPCALLIEAFAIAAEKRRDPRRRRREASGGTLEHAITLVHILCNEAGITDDVTLAGSVLFDTISETQLTYGDLRRQFGPVLAEVVAELTEESSAPLKDRPAIRLQAGGTYSHRARLIKLASLVAAIRELARDAQGDESMAERAAFDALLAAVDALRGTHATLECLFDEEYYRGE
ncbi:MAG: hypothetical protein U1F52_06060 [Burkholderiales bacterium]